MQAEYILGEDPVVGYCEHGNKVYVSIRHCCSISSTTITNKTYMHINMQWKYQ